MPWFPMYADESDLGWLTGWLNRESEIAWIVSDGPKRWKVVMTQEPDANCRRCLWHVASGPLPLLPRYDDQPPFIDDPWAGWTEPEWQPDQHYLACPPETRKHLDEMRATRDSDPDPLPMFPTQTGVIWLNARAKGRDGPGSVGLSSFEWVGNYFRPSGKEAPQGTVDWWQRMSRVVKKRAARVPRKGPLDGKNPEIWALPSALEKIRDGVGRDES